jgi:hypothetical protein
MYRRLFFPVWGALPMLQVILQVASCKRASCSGQPTTIQFKHPWVAAISPQSAPLLLQYTVDQQEHLRVGGFRWILHADSD